MDLSCSKTNRNWESGLRGIEKKATLKPKPSKNHFVSPGIWESITYRFVTRQLIGIAASLIRQRVGTFLYFKKGFTMGRMGELLGDWQGHRRPWLRNLFNRGWRPLKVSSLSGCCFGWETGCDLFIL